MISSVKNRLNTSIGSDPTISTFIPTFSAKENFSTVFGSFFHSFIVGTACACGFTATVFKWSKLFLCLQSARPPLVRTRFNGLGLMVLLYSTSFSDSSSSDSDSLEVVDEQVNRESESQKSGSSFSLSAPLYNNMSAASSAEYFSIDSKICD